MTHPNVKYKKIIVYVAKYYQRVYVERDSLGQIQSLARWGCKKDLAGIIEISDVPEDVSSALVRCRVVSKCELDHHIPPRYDGTDIENVIISLPFIILNINGKIKN